MRVSAQAFSSPKAGNEESENEDAFWPDRPIISGKESIYRFAVADGATETSFSAIWAKQLVRAFCKGQLEEGNFAADIRPLQERWHKIVSRKPMAWYAEEKVRTGAFAAIVGLLLTDPPDQSECGAWRSLALGDSCLVQLRDKNLITSFPIQSSNQFNNSPFLLSSRGAHDNDTQRPLSAEGTWRKGDTFYLLTDAVASWFLTQVERGRVPSRELQDLSLNKSNHFNSWLHAIRESKAIRNDDVTILRVEIENC